MPITPYARIPIVTGDWTLQTIATLKAANLAVLNENYLEMWPSADAFVAAAPINGPLRTAPSDDSLPFQPHAIRPSSFPPGTPLIFALDASGKPVAENFAAATTGGNVGQNPPETFRNPGTGTPTLTMEVLGGASFASFWFEYGGWFTNGIPRFVSASPAGLWNLNFSQAKPFQQLAIAYYNPQLGSYPYTWPRDIIPYITDDGGIAIVKVEEVKKLGKFGVKAPAGTALHYANDGATTYKAAAGLVATVDAGGMTPAAAGDALNNIARRTV